MKDRLVTLATQSYYRSQLLKERLEEAGIDCFLKNPDMAGTVAEEGLKVRIRAQDFEKALSIAEAIKKEFGEEDIKIPEENIQINRILVPIGFMDYSLKACYYALDIAEQLQADIHLFHTYYNPYLDPAPFADDIDYHINFDQYIQEIENNARERLKSLVSDLKQKIYNRNIQNVNVDYSLMSGSIDEQIVNINEAYQPDLIVLGTKGKHKKHNDFIGRVTSKITESVDIPVLAVPSDTQHDIRTNINIMYTTNLDDSDFPAFQKLMALTAPFNPHLYCVHIENDPDNPVVNAKMNQLKEYFAKYFNQYNIECKVLQDQDLLSGIQHFIDQNNIDLIATTMHKKNMLMRLFQPDNTKKIMFHTNMPLLVFHS